MNVTPTIRGPAFTKARFLSRSSILSAVADIARSDAAVVFLAADLRHEHAFAVDADLDLVRELQAGQVADDVAEKLDAELVLGILREVVLEEQAAASAERQSLDVILLRRRRAARDSPI